jgi:DNA polymerase alpha subunit A
LTEVDGKYVEKLEVKGLDMKRREYCALSKEVSSKLLNEILSGDDQEVVLNKVHEYLRELADRMKEYTIPVQKYVIYTVRHQAQICSACSANSLIETFKTTPGVP